MRIYLLILVLLIVSSSRAQNPVPSIQCGIDYVQFYIDDQPIGPKITTPDADGKYRLKDWDSNQVHNGHHQIIAKAYDKSGGLSGGCTGQDPNVGISTPVPVFIQNKGSNK